MLRSLFNFLIFLLISNAAVAQQTREELEKQRQQLKREIEETQKLLGNVNDQKKVSLTTLGIYSNKVNLQNRIVENIGKDIHILDNNIYTIQKDLNRYDRLLDTLKQEYAKSMVYSYKNRGNYDFLNFIFSADNFNDAIKRVAYLKSYRTYREMQGQNILRTQELRKKRLEELGVSKQKKSSTLEVQSKEMQELETQKQQQNKIVVELQKNAKSLNDKLAAKKKQAARVNSLIDAAIKEAIAKARREAEAKAAADAKRRRDAELAEAKRLADEIKKNNATAAATGKPVIKPAAPVIIKEKPRPAAPASILLNDDKIIALNTSFERNKGSLPWPVDNGSVIMHFGINKLANGGEYRVVSTTIASAIGSSVKTVFDGEVKVVNDDIVIIQHGRYFTTYSNLSNVSVHAGTQVKTGDVIGKVASNDDGIGAIDFQASDERNNFDAEKWLRRRN